MPSTQVDVSILVLAYNHAPFIAECLDGLLAQDFAGEVEILIGEDCSTDSTPEIRSRSPSSPMAATAAARSTRTGSTRVA